MWRKAGRRMVRSPASSRPFRRASRALACALVAAFAWIFVAPSVEGMTAANDRCCRRGVCCHHRNASDSACVRGLCPCGGHDDGTPTPPVQFNAVLPIVTALLADRSFVREPAARSATPRSLDLSPPHAPPRLSLAS